MKKKSYIVLIAFVMLLCGCSNGRQAAKTENEQLKYKITQLEKELNDKSVKLTDYILGMHRSRIAEYNLLIIMRLSRHKRFSSQPEVRLTFSGLVAYCSPE